MVLQLNNYKSQGETEAGRIGWHVVNYMIDKEYDVQTNFRQYPDYEGPHPAVSWLPSGAVDPTPNNQVDLVGSEGWAEWRKSISGTFELS